MSVGLGTQAALSVAQFARLRREAIFSAGKLDPQVGDHEALADFPLTLDATTWRTLAFDAEALARELAAAEAELLGRPELHAELDLPRAVRRALSESPRLGRAVGAARFVRFDFHPTEDGWRISEANADVPGGFIEAGPLSRLVARHYPGWAPVGDPAEALADAVARIVPVGGRVGLLYATAYVDDHQVMACIGRALERRGLGTCLSSPTNVVWRDGRAVALRNDGSRPFDLLLRFFPAEWLPGAGRASGWPWFFRGSVTPLSNPGHALLVQGKRLPLLFDRLRTELPTWRRLLPETRDPRDAPWRSDASWLLKPTWGRVGEAIHMAGVTPAKDAKRIARNARWFPRAWVAQRRFASVPLLVGGVPRHACLGIYCVDGRVAGAYGRVGTKPLIDGDAQDVAVLVRAGEAT